MFSEPFLVPSKIFDICMFVTLLAWVLLLVAPRFFVTKRLVRSGFVSLFFAAVYTAIAVYAAIHLRPEGKIASFSWVKNLFHSDWALLGGWVHYLSFDLLVGSAVLQDLEDRRQSSFLSRLIILWSVFLAGPVGFLLSRFLWRGHKR